MHKNEKAPAGVSAPTRAAGKGLPTAFPVSNSITRYKGNPLISDFLHVGTQNALTLRELVQLTGEDERTLRRRIQQERKAGVLILSDCQHGYFLPENESDVRRFIRSMSRRSREIAAVSRIAEDTLARLSGQEHLEGWNA